MLTIEEFASRLKGVRKGGRDWSALCPAHDDHNPSLTFRADGRGIRFHCHAGCTRKEVLAAMGLEGKDVFEPDDRGSCRSSIEATYDYVDEAGKLLYQTVRRFPKKFYQRRPAMPLDPPDRITRDPDGREWVNSLKGPDGKPIPRALYRLPGVIAAVADGRTVFVVEGEKDADAMDALGVVATTSPQGAGKWEDSFAAPLATAARIVVCPDNDPPPKNPKDRGFPGQRYAAGIVRSLLKAGVDPARIRVVEFPGAKDASDWIAAGGTVDDLRRLVDAAPDGRAWMEAWGPRLSGKPSTPGTVPPARTPAPDPRPAMAVDGDLAAIVAGVWPVLLDLNQPGPTLFRSPDASLVVGVRDGDDGPAIRVHGIDSVRLLVSQLIRWYRLDADSGDERPAYPPDSVVKSVLAEPSIRLPALARIVSVPIVGRNGEIQTEPGYHAASRTFYAPAPGFEVPPVPAEPTPEDVARARDVLLVPLADFPFVGASDRAHALAAILLPFVRELIDGPTPLHMVSKPAPGTGAGLLCDGIAMIATGRAAPAGVVPTDENETRKRLTAAFLDGVSILMLDNVTRILGGSALSSALTATTWTDRVLGRSTNTALPIRCLWLATGNNPKTTNEVVRRVVRIGLDAKVERPWERDGFRIPDLRIWIAQHRGELVGAALTLVRAWVCAGRPGCDVSLGSYEAWAAVIGGILAVAGVDGFLANLSEFYDQADVEGRNDRAFVEAWWDKHGDKPMGVADLYPLAVDVLELGDGGERSQRTRLGRSHLFRLRDRVVAGHRVCEADKYQGAQRWRLEEVLGEALVNVGVATFTGGSSEKDSQSSDFVNVVNVAQPRVRADACDRAGSCACMKAECPDVHDVHKPEEGVCNPAKTRMNPVVNVAVNVGDREDDPDADYPGLDWLTPGGEA